MIEKLKPVRTRLDCMDWLTEKDVDLEIYAALRGAQKYYEDFDFSSGLDDGFDSLIEGTVISKTHGEPVVDRECFLETVVMFIAWRLWALGERKGVHVHSFDVDLPPGMETAMQALKTSPWHPWLNATVKEVNITPEQFKALPPDVQKLMRKIAKSGKPFIEKI